MWEGYKNCGHLIVIWSSNLEGRTEKNHDNIVRIVGVVARFEQGTSPT